MRKHCLPLSFDYLVLHFRWEVIDVVRTLSTEKVKAGEEGADSFKFSRSPEETFSLYSFPFFIGDSTYMLFSGGTGSQ